MAKSKLIIEVDGKRLYDGIKSMEGKVDQLIEHAKETNGKVKANATEIGKLKQFKAKAAVILGAITVIATMIGNLIIHNLKLF